MTFCRCFLPWDFYFHDNIKLIMKENSVARFGLSVDERNFFAISINELYPTFLDFAFAAKKYFIFNGVNMWNTFTLFLLFIYKLVCNATWNKFIKSKIYLENLLWKHDKYLNFTQVFYIVVVKTWEEYNILAS